jgi:Domain of unknown function (DUF4157)
MGQSFERPCRRTKGRSKRYGLRGLISCKPRNSAEGGKTVRAKSIKCLRRSVYELLQERGFRLRGPLLRRMESTLCSDFSDVVVHVSPLSCALNNFFGAQAFTIGNHICFSEGTFDPRSDFGQRLLADELAHVIQKRLGKDGIGQKKEFQVRRN